MVDRQSATEYRVVWQRVGYDKRRKIFGRRDAAERYVKRLLGEMPVLPDMGDDDDYACCSGWECGCGGQTVARAREEELHASPPCQGYLNLTRSIRRSAASTSTDPDRRDPSPARLPRLDRARHVRAERPSRTASTTRTRWRSASRRSTTTTGCSSSAQPRHAGDQARRVGHRRLRGAQGAPAARPGQPQRPVDAVAAERTCTSRSPTRASTCSTTATLFVGRHVYKPFVGYATQQLYKMEHGAFKGYMGEKRKALVERTATTRRTPRT
jgi:hypothetical protein